MEITSLNNSKVKYWEKLKEKKYRDEEHFFLIEDEHLLEEALKINVVKEIITADKNKIFSVPTYYVTNGIMKKISSQTSGAKLIAVCEMLKKRNIEGNIVILDSIQDPGNLGAIIRSAVAFDFKTIVMSKDTVDIYNPKAIRASEGMLFHINIIKTDLIDFLNNLDKEYTKVTTDVKIGKNINTINHKKIALVIGNEGCGVKKEISNLCDELVHIKMNNDCESLNAAVSASILMYEVYNG